jgi:hypothetical protein
MKKRVTATLGCAIAAALALSAAPVVQAKDGDVRVAGTCTKASSAKLKLSEEDGRVEVEFEVDQNRVGAKWAVVLRKTGVVVARATRTTRAPSGSFTFRMLANDGPGAERFVATATSRSGETCRAQASF